MSSDNLQDRSLNDSTNKSTADQQSVGNNNADLKNISAGNTPPLHQLGQPPQELPSLYQLASSAFMPARVILPPLGLLARPLAIKPRHGLFPHLQPCQAYKPQGLSLENLDPTLGQVHPKPAFNLVELKPDLSHANRKPALGQVNLKPGPAAHPKPPPSSLHTINEEMDSVASEGLNVLGTASHSASRDHFEVSSPAKSRKKKKPVVVESVSGIEFTIPLEDNRSVYAKQVSKSLLGLIACMSAKVPFKVHGKAPVKVPLRKKHPRGRKAKATTNLEVVAKPAKSAPKKKVIKPTGSGELSSTLTIRKSKRIAAKQAFLKAAAEEEERRDVAMSIQQVKEHISMEAEHTRHHELAEPLLGQPDKPSQQAESSQQHSGNRLKKLNYEKRKREETDVGHSNIKKAKGKGKASNTR
ncbi:uncharacterized protein EV154DRAFT_603243 [Mucor mucedo]|uniref:uncharacterized protein n=1 Tax=Mucor mucedo TaxID=29922 RepID=UPI0022208D29|nr:uncharacterized protein EV154DRAFT_603243 [Mucor mucedo]KAI7890387.1 hypothetical protein EV154DRAFT_603243 [Mucor mucedo]